MTWFCKCLKKKISPVNLRLKTAVFTYPYCLLITILKGPVFLVVQRNFVVRKMTLSTTPISYRESRIFDELFLDYSEEKNELRSFYAYPPNSEGIQQLIAEQDYSTVDRKTLFSVLNRQYQGIEASPATKKNLDLLAEAGTYTITTGHQLCLFTGPLYFIYKIISAINWCEELNKKMPGKHFVPVYWMATEDHDIEEINHVHVFGKKITWNTDQKGKAGELSTEGIKAVIDELAQVLGTSTEAEELIRLLENAYVNSGNLAAATRCLVNKLFGQYGLVIVDADDVQLKKLFVKEMQADLFAHKAFETVGNSVNQLKEAGYKIQVNPRQINLFYTQKGMRERIEQEGEQYKVMNTGLVFTKASLEKELQENTAAFSPNVVLRPLYQQKILPNAAYVGGPGELAYWLEYKAMFDEQNIVFPVLLPRLFIFYGDKPSSDKIKKLGIAVQDLFLETETLLKNFVKTENENDLSVYRTKLETVFDELKKEIEQTDKTIGATADAEKQKALNGISIIEQKLIRALKAKNETELNQLKKLKEKFFPNNVPQERVENFASFFIRNTSFIATIKESCNVASANVIFLSENP